MMHLSTSSFAMHKVLWDMLYTYIHILRVCIDSYTLEKSLLFSKVKRVVSNFEGKSWLLSSGYLRAYINRPLSHTHFVHCNWWRSAKLKCFTLTTCAQLCFNVQHVITQIMYQERLHPKCKPCLLIFLSCPIRGVSRPRLPFNLIVAVRSAKHLMVIGD